MKSGMKVLYSPLGAASTRRLPAEQTVFRVLVDLGVTTCREHFTGLSNLMSTPTKESFLGHPRITAPRFLSPRSCPGRDSGHVSCLLDAQKLFQHGADCDGGKKLGQRIPDLRRSRKLTQTQLAKKVGCSVDFISLVERGVNAPTVARLEKFAKALTVGVGELFTFGERKR